MAFFVYAPGDVVNATVGACVSTVHANVAFGLVALPFTAWIRSVWGPSARPLRVVGLKQAAKGSPSSEHSNAALASSLWKPTVKPVA